MLGEQEYYEEMENILQNEDKDYHNPTQTFNLSRVYKDCSFGANCFCEDECVKKTYYTNTRHGQTLAPRPNGNCYCGRIREQCPNYIAYGTDCQGFGNVKFT